VRCGIDAGASWTDAVAVEGGKIIGRASARSSEATRLDLRELAEGFDSVGIVGGKLEGAKKIGEIAAIAAGAAFLSGKKRGLCANVGTGTPFVLFEAGKARHLGGTGVGGGTIDGLAKLLLGADAAKLEKIAGSARGADLTVRDVVGSGIGAVPGDATAANFGRIAGATRADVAASIIKLAAESVAVSASFAARSEGIREIIFTGRAAAKNKMFRARVSAACKIFGIGAVFPKDAEYCTAAGAAVLA